MEGGEPEQNEKKKRKVMEKNDCKKWIKEGKEKKMKI